MKFLIVFVNYVYLLSWQPSGSKAISYFLKNFVDIYVIFGTRLDVDRDAIFCYEHSNSFISVHEQKKMSEKKEQMWKKNKPTPAIIAI